MQALWMALLMGLLIGINPRVKMALSAPRQYFIGWAWRAAIATPLMWLVFYFIMPAFVGPFWGMFLFVVLGLAINWISTWKHFKGYRFNPEDRAGSGMLAGISGALVALGLVLWLLSTQWFAAGTQHDMLGEVTDAEFEVDWSPIQPDHMLQVAQEQARNLADQEFSTFKDKDLETLGSLFHVGQLSKQLVDGRIVWVAPLEYNGWGAWTSGQQPPGYVMVSAENKDAKVKLVTSIAGERLSFKYVPSACFSDNLKRYLYFEKGYKSVCLVDKTLELDDSGRPFYVVTMTKPTYLWTGTDVVGILIVDPQTGGVQEFLKKDFNKVPSWVDRIRPEDLTATHINWWGTRRGDWWNRNVAEVDLVKATEYLGDQLKIVLGPDNRTYWFTGITSTSAKDGALVYYMLVDTRTGKAFRYHAKGKNETKVIEAINGAVSNFAGWHSERPVLYNVHGRKVWGASVVDASHIYKRFAVVWADQINMVALGDSKVDASQNLEQKILSGSSDEALSDESRLRDVSGTITVVRIWTRDGNSSLFFTLDSMPGTVLTASLSVGTEVPILEEGDWVELTILDTQEGRIPVKTLNSRKPAKR